MKETLKRIGMAGLCFFLIKGVLWLIVPAAIALWTAARNAQF